ncbi:lysophospholipid acyltransferase family protein [Arthrobacter sp. VKM Ac-2550]|uniref:lysophospholipid acyltransferase family protein n=1 Tax=Crystallibacter permensis TaxID=1938888 RepID=UPI002227E285|nr:lysophospholipid acyltransferase family protein [Arthrobacter sp. VKM Ac-2550]MCW2133249.1 1-acyl-sn-glycerol-3-phosphate acyltransferase [Arthrobacter sp. VKM Ac-2550]
MFYWVMKTIFIGPVVRLLFRPWIKGLDNIPDGPAILASNHMSFSDSIFLPLAVPRPVVFLAKSEYFNGRGLKGRMTAAFFRLTNQLPMDRSGGAASASSLSGGADVLNAGGLLGIYPEGTRSPDGRLYRGKTGVAKLVLSTGVPVVPVAMIGTDKVQPIGRRIPNIRRVGTIIGKPLDFSRYKGLENDRFIQRSVTDEIMYEIMRLSGQEYVDVYANTVKAQQAARKSAKAGQDQRKAEAVGAVGEALQKPGTVKAPGAITIIGNPESLPTAPGAGHTEHAPSAHPVAGASSFGATDSAGDDDSGQPGGGRKPHKPGA